MKKGLNALVLVSAVALAGAISHRAEAFVAAPASVFSNGGEQDVLKVRWVCGDTRCYWQPWNVFHPGHSWARNWQPPRNPGCYWEKQRGRWTEVCPY
jgi:hypothetical protein